MKTGVDQKIDTSQKKSAFEYFTEIIGWIQIMASPPLIAAIFAALLYFPNPSKARLIFGLILVFIGLIVGIIWATRIWKKQGTISFMSSIMSNPKSDSKDEDHN